MRADEVDGAAELARLTLRGGVSRVREVHQGVAQRVFRAAGPVGRPVRLWHDAVLGLSYAGVGVALGVGARLVGSAAARRANGQDLDEERRGRVLLGVLNGAHGDLVQQAAPGLDPGMTVRVAGRTVALDAPSLRTAFPSATGRVVVFVHGLTETEDSWGYGAQKHHGRDDVTFGSLLEADLGMTPVYLRYNTGLHISDNGRALAGLLDEFVAAWPEAVQDLVLIGHSMGGLVARSALHQAGSGTAEAQGWTRLVRDTVTLGSPHLGAPLERGLHRMALQLARLPETRPLARVLSLRSAGIKDLGHGALVEDDWTGPDLGRAVGTRTPVPLHDGARHFVVMATVSRNPEGRVAELFGDLLVSPRSALGDTGGEDRLAFPADHVERLGGLHHVDLLGHPRVYAAIRRWLLDRPEGPRPSAPGTPPAG